MPRSSRAAAQTNRKFAANVTIVLHPSSECYEQDALLLTVLLQAAMKERSLEAIDRFLIKLAH